MTTAKIELLEPANYTRLLKTELKDSGGAVVPLRYVYDRANKQPAVIFVGEVGSGMYSLMKKADPGVKLLPGKIAETEKAFLFEIGPALTDKALTVMLLDAGIRKPALRVKNVAQALAAMQKSGGPSKDELELTAKAEKAFEGLKTRLDVAKKWAADNHKARLLEAIKQFKEEVEAQKGKEAVASVISLSKALQVIESTDLREPAELLERITELEKQRDDLKNPALHPKFVKALNEKLSTVRKALDAEKASDWKAHGQKLDEVLEELNDAADMARVFKSDRKEYRDLDKEIKKLDRAKVQRLPGKKEDLVKLEKAVDDALRLAPTEIQPATPYEPFSTLIRAARELMGYMREALKPAEKPDLNTLEGRKQAYVYDDSSTWVMNALVYKNKTNSANLPATLIDLLKKGQLASNTTAGGSVLKTGFEGHAHINGGSGGMAFVYQFDEAQCKVTPIVVDVAYARGNGKDKNKYAWETGGRVDYFPPLAKY
jgi:hypothetical protein